MSILESRNRKWWNTSPFKEFVTIILAIIAALFMMFHQSKIVNNEIKPIYAEIDQVRKDNKMVEVDGWDRNGKQSRVWIMPKKD